MTKNNKKKTPEQTRYGFSQLPETPVKPDEIAKRMFKKADKKLKRKRHQNRHGMVSVNFLKPQ